jgi:hypothetical protein
MKKAAGKKSKSGKSKAPKKAQAAKTTRSSKPADMGAVREKISKIVSGAAANIARKLVNKAEDGELAHSKYLFEMTGVYPMEDAAGKPPEEESLAKTLLQRMGLPTTPVVEEENGDTRELVVAEPSQAPAEAVEKDAEVARVGSEEEQ